MYWNTFVSLRFLQKSCCNSNRNEACRFLSWNDEKAIERGKTARGLIFHFRSSDILVDGVRTLGCCNRCCIERWIPSYKLQ